MIVATLLEPRLTAIQDAIAACDPTADAFEVRFDACEEPTAPQAVRALTPKPLIGTVRRMADGGVRPMPEDARLALLKACAEAGFDFIDLELDDPPLGAPEQRIRSRHDLRATPPRATMLRLARATEAGSTFKFAAKTRALSETMQVLIAARVLQKEGKPHAIMGLGDFQRALMRPLGARLLYGGGRTNAPGQPGHAAVAATLRHWGMPQAASRILLVIGDPIDHSLSPRMHNAALQRAGLDLAYGALRITDHTELQMLFDRAELLGLAGLSVTTPLKDAAFEVCTRHAPEAQAARAVNCIQFQDGRAIGHNTDGKGAAAVARRLVGPNGYVMIIGAGGAARAFAHEWPSTRLTVAGRTPETLRELVRVTRCRAIPMSLAPEEMHEADLIINANRETDPMPLGEYKGALFDFHYNATPTVWQQAAERRGLPFAGGRDLLLEQGVRAYRLWTGTDPDVDAMRAALEAAP